jgi:hypothetical protein
MVIPCSLIIQFHQLHSKALNKTAHSFHTRSFSARTCHRCTPHHRDRRSEFWSGERCSACVEALSACLEWLLHLEIWPCHGPTQHHLHFPLQPDWTTPPPLTRFHLYMFVCFKGFMVDVKAWAGCMSSLTQLVCTPAAPMMIG